MNRILPLLVSVVVSVLALAPAAPAEAGQVSATALATVTILDPSSITPTRGMSFGAVGRPANDKANTVVMDASGKVTMSGGGNGAVTPGGFAAARIELGGQPGVVYSISQSLSFEGQGLSHATGILGGAVQGGSRTIPRGGVDVLTFGGAFQVDPSAPAGQHVGALSIIANYN